jgi:ribosome-binding factor A
MAESNRRARVERSLRDELAALIIRGEIRDVTPGAVVVSRVQLSGDLGVAKVLVRHLAGDRAAAELELERLRAQAGPLRGRLGRALRLRAAPELRFAYDEGQDNATRIDELLHEIATERKQG